MSATFKAALALKAKSLVPPPSDPLVKPIARTSLNVTARVTGSRLERSLAHSRSLADLHNRCEDAMQRALIPAALMSAAMLSAAQAQTIGTATTDLNLRSGPGPEHAVMGMMRDRQRASVMGCIEGSRWCQVDFRGRIGWAYSQYMILDGQLAAVLPAPEVEVDVDTNVVSDPPVSTYNNPVVAYRPAPLVTAPVVTYRAPVPAGTYQAPAPVVAYQTAPTYRAPAPAVTYRAPVPTTVVETTAAAPREFAGTLIAPREVVYAATTPPRAFTPSRSVRTYINANPLETVWLDGSLVVGAGIPDDIDLVSVPNSSYHYAFVNDYPVLVDPNTRRIMHVYR